MLSLTVNLFASLTRPEENQARSFPGGISVDRSAISIAK